MTIENEAAGTPFDARAEAIALLDGTGGGSEQVVDNGEVAPPAEDLAAESGEAPSQAPDGSSEPADEEESGDKESKDAEPKKKNRKQRQKRKLEEAKAAAAEMEELNLKLVEELNAHRAELETNVAYVRQLEARLEELGHGLGQDAKELVGHRLQGMRDAKLQELQKEHTARQAQLAEQRQIADLQSSLEDLAAEHNVPAEGDTPAWERIARYAYANKMDTAKAAAELAAGSKPEARVVGAAERQVLANQKQPRVVGRNSGQVARSDYQDNRDYTAALLEQEFPELF